MNKDSLFRCVQRARKSVAADGDLSAENRWTLGCATHAHPAVFALGITVRTESEWATLDTFDMYSPAHDHPRSLAEVRRWFDSAG